MTQSRFTILKRFSYLLSAHWVREVLQAIFIVTLARHATETYGQFMLAMNVGAILLFATEFGFNQHLATMLARKAKSPSKRLGQVSVIKTGLLVIGWVCMIGFIFWQDYSAELRVIIVVLATGIALQGLASTFFVACQVLGRQDVEGKTRGMASIFGYGYGLTALLLGLPPAAVALFKGVESLANLTVVVRGFARHIVRRVRLSDLSNLWSDWREGLVYTSMAICAIFYNKINIFFLQKYAGPHGVAQYSATWEIVSGISSLISGMLLARVLFPLFAKYWGSDRERFLSLARQSAAWLVAVALPVSYVLVVECDRIIPLIYGDDYGQAATLQPILTGCILLAFVHNLAAYLMISMHHQRILLGMYVAGLTVNVAACMLLIPNAPLEGTAYAILLTKLIMAMMTVGYCQMAIGLFTFKNMRDIVLAVAVSAALHFPLSSVTPREIVELLALAPLLLSAYRLYRRQQRDLTAKDIPF